MVASSTILSYPMIRHRFCCRLDAPILETCNGRCIASAGTRMHLCMSLLFESAVVPRWPIMLQVSAGQNHTLALSSSNVVWSWGSNEMGQLGLGSASGCQMLPSRVQDLPTQPILFILAGGDHSLVVMRQSQPNHTCLTGTFSHPSHSHSDHIVRLKLIQPTEHEYHHSLQMCQ